MDRREDIIGLLARITARCLSWTHSYGSYSRPQFSHLPNPGGKLGVEKLQRCGEAWRACKGRGRPTEPRAASEATVTHEKLSTPPLPGDKLGAAGNRLFAFASKSILIPPSSLLILLCAFFQSLPMLRAARNCGARLGRMFAVALSHFPRSCYVQVVHTQQPTFSFLEFPSLPRFFSLGVLEPCSCTQSALLIRVMALPVVYIYRGGCHLGRSLPVRQCSLTPSTLFRIRPD
jgi:hypothetical protein